jgi:dihydrofolate reductase/thymidylate synthase
MSIAKFSVIVFVDADNGMSKDGSPPLSPPSWKKFFRDKTIGSTSVDATGKRSTSAVIMGRHTYEMFKASTGDKDHLPNRQNYVISKSYQQQDFSNIIVYKSLLNCLVGIAGLSSVRTYEKVWIIGGERLFREALSRYLPYCEKVYIGKLRNETLGCDLIFSCEELKRRNIIPTKELSSSEYDILTYEPHVQHQEMQYLQLLKECIEAESSREFDEDYTKTRNKSLNFNIREELPLITTRDVDFAMTITELVEDLSNPYFKYDTFGFRMRNINKFTGEKEYAYDGDQLNSIVEDLSRHKNKTILTERSDVSLSFSPAFLKFEIVGKYLMTSVYFSRCEVFRFLPHYMLYISLLASIIANHGGWIVNNLHISICDALLLDKYKDFAKKQIRYDPKPFPRLMLKNNANHSTIFDYCKDNFSIQNYDSWVKINLDRR